MRCTGRSGRAEEPIIESDATGFPGRGSIVGTLAPRPAVGQPAAAFERFADEIEFFGPNDFLYGFRQSWLPPDAFVPIERFSQFLTDRRWRAGDVLPLLNHRDAKVRTLALTALYHLEDPALLPRIFELIDDAAQTFPALHPHAGPFPVEITPQMLRQQTVGKLAAAILNVYMESGGCTDRKADVVSLAFSNIGTSGQGVFRQPGDGALRLARA